MLVVVSEFGDNSAVASALISFCVSSFAQPGLRC